MVNSPVALEHFMLILDGIFLYVTVRSSRFARLILSRWEFFTAIAFDWNYLTTKKKFKWPAFVRPGSPIIRRVAAVMMLSSYTSDQSRLLSGCCDLQLHRR